MSYRGFDTHYNNDLEFLFQLKNKINEIMQGRLNVGGEVTLTANQATTTITLPTGILSTTSKILFTATTANAAAEIGAGGFYVSSKDVANKQITITHANNAQPDRTFDYVIIG